MWDSPCGNIRQGRCLRPSCGCESYCRAHGLPSPSCRTNHHACILPPLLIRLITVLRWDDASHPLVATFGRRCCCCSYWHDGRCGGGGSDADSTGGGGAGAGGVGGSDSAYYTAGVAAAFVAAVVLVQVPAFSCCCFLVRNMHGQRAAVRYVDTRLQSFAAASYFNGQGLAFSTDLFGSRPAV